MRDDAVLGRALPLDRGLGPRHRELNSTRWQRQLGTGKLDKLLSSTQPH